MPGDYTYSGEVNTLTIRAGLLCLLSILAIACHSEGTHVHHPVESRDADLDAISPQPDLRINDAMPILDETRVSDADARDGGSGTDAVPLSADMSVDSDRDAIRPTVDAEIDPIDQMFVTDAFPMDVSPLDPPDALPVQPPQDPRCGDGSQDANEKCDDGNERSDDACDTACTPTEHRLTASQAQLLDRVVRGANERIFVHFEDATQVQFLVSGLDECHPIEGVSVEVWAPGADAPMDTQPLDMPQPDDCVWQSFIAEAGEYEFRVTYQGADPDAVFSFSLNQFREIEPGETYRGGFGIDGDDRYEFRLQAADRIILESGAVDLLCGGNTWFTLYRINMDRDQFVEMDANGAGGRCSRIEMRLGPGHYALVVRETRHGAIPSYFLRFRTSGVCGDGRLNVDEECDDGNRNNDDECSLACEIQPVCGNGQTEIGETCDDGNTVGGDGCSADCQAELLCGNGRLDGNEACDDGNENVGDGCDQLCSLENFDILVGQARIISQFSLGGFDRYRFHADGPSRLDIYTYVNTPIPCRPSQDTLILLFAETVDGNLVELFRNDDDPENPPCSRLTVDVAEGPHQFIIREAQDRLTINRYDMDFRLVRDVTNLEQFDGGFPEDGADRYTFTVDQRQAVAFTVRPVDGMCPDGVELHLFPRAELAPFETQQMNVNGCPTISRVFDPGQYDVRIRHGDGAALPQYSISALW